MSYMAAHEFIRPATTLLPDNTATGTNNGSAVDTLGYEDCLVVFHAGATATTGTVDVKVQESNATGSGWADISGATFTQVTTANDDAIYVGRISLVGRKRYLRAVATIATSAADMGVSVLLCAAQVQAVSQANTVAFNLDPT